MNRLAVKLLPDRPPKCYAVEGNSVGLHAYVSDFAKRLLAAQAWIDNGGPATSTAFNALPNVGATPGPMPPTGVGASDGESEIDVSDPGLGGDEPPVVSK